MYIYLHVRPIITRSETLYKVFFQEADKIRLFIPEHRWDESSV